MAIVSMTGFGNAKGSTSDVEIEIVLKSVNARFLEVKTHQPREYLIFEAEIKKLIKTFFNRGNIDVFISRKTRNVKKMVKLNEDVLASYFLNLKKINARFKIPVAISFGDLLKAEGVLNLVEKHKPITSEKSFLFKLLKQALSKARENRLREGRDLYTELFRLLKTLKELKTKIEEKIVKAQVDRSQRLHARFKRNQPEEAGRAIHEIAAILEKSDIQEELVRISTHIQFCFSILKSEKSPGKSLEFYAQELLREMNTIGSKAQVAEIAHLVVRSKTTIDQFKEQVLNIE